METDYTNGRKESKKELLSDPGLAYDKAVGLVGLVSQEIYNRFNATMTMHGFLLAALGLVITSGAGNTWVGCVLFLELPIAGWFLCDTWREFVDHGLKTQEFFRKEARRIEETYDQSLDIFTRLHETTLIHENPQVKRGLFRKSSNFQTTSHKVITVFRCIYAFTLAVAVIDVALKLFWYLTNHCTGFSLRCAP